MCKSALRVRREPAGERDGERRARIVEAARKVIISGGLDGLTMRQLAESARVSVPTVDNMIGNSTSCSMR